MGTAQAVVTGYDAEPLHLREAIVALVACVNLLTGVNLKAFKNLIQQPSRLTHRRDRKETSLLTHTHLLSLSAEAIMALKDLIGSRRTDKRSRPVRRYRPGCSSEALRCDRPVSCVSRPWRQTQTAYGKFSTQRCFSERLLHLTGCVCTLL